jgi:peptidyl-prolyl cis-trans isomerase A (cyclophilin A)
VNDRSALRSTCLAALCAAAIALAPGCSKSADTAASSSGSGAPQAQGPKVDIVTTDGTIVATLDPVHAPKTVANFLHYVDTKFYNGGTFFRAVPGFVIQGGNKTKESPSDKPIELEDPQTTGLKNVDGALAMARTSDPNSATSEFFIDIGPQAYLDGGNGMPGYAVFGNVVSGMDVVNKIVAGQAASQMLVTPVKILKIERAK